ncbi:S41 family peptidase [Sorangium sp. So ce296]|uniref:S41 family peptidase n=1 Tax=Sorangium sp. So ce296 TaxID=3133296 RepID=UPI003F603AD8
MLPAAHRGAGQNVSFPDVCLTPPAPGVPVPYTNLGMHAMAAPFSPTVMVAGLPALNLSAKIPITTGDEAGALHPTIKGQGTFVAGSPTVMVDGLPAINLTAPATGNAMNAPKGEHLIPNAVSVFYNLASAAPGAGQAAGEAMREVAEALVDAPPPAAALLPGGVGLVRVAVMAPDAPARVFAGIRRLEEAEGGLRALILDLRGCPGGELDAALRLAEDFLPRGAELGAMIDADGDAMVRRSRRDPAFELPVVALVDGGTASAAEVLAGSLQAHGRALLVGARTHGKGSVQSVVQTPEGLCYATVGRWLLPGGVELEGRGLTPDVAAEGEGDPEVDAALRAAWEAARRNTDSRDCVRVR